MTEHSDILLWLTGLPILTCLALSLLRGQLTARSVRMLSILSATAHVGLAATAISILQAVPSTADVAPVLQASVGTWLSSGPLNVTIAFSLDPLSSVFLILVAILALAAQLSSYDTCPEKEKSISRSLAAQFFIFGLVVLILAKNLLLLFLGWEVAALAAAYLFGQNKTTGGRFQTDLFVVTRVASFAFLIGLFLVGFYSDGDLDLTRLEALFQAGGALDPLSVPGSVDQANARYAVVTMLSALFLLAAAGMSAQFPLHVWFAKNDTQSVEGFALVHACAMTTTGIYLLSRLHSIYSISEEVMTVVAGLGACTALIGATSALAQTNIRRLLAYAALSQTGFIFMAFGVGAFNASVYQAIVFACVMPGLFLAAELIAEFASTTDITQGGSVRSALPKTRWLTLLLCAALAGLLPLPGFLAKEHALSATLSHFHHGAGPQTLIFGIGVAAAFLAAIAIFRFYALTFAPEAPERSSEIEPTNVESGMRIAPLLLLAVLSVLVGLLGLPQAISIDQPLGDWLAPVFAGSDVHFTTPNEQQFGLAAILLGAGGYAAWLIARLRVGRSAPLEKGEKASGLRAFFEQGWYVQQVTTALFARPCMALSNLLARKIPTFRSSRSQEGRIDAILLAVLTTGGLTLVLLTTVLGG